MRGPSPQARSFPRVQSRNIPAGDAGASITLRKMQVLVNQSLTDPVVINTAKSIVRFLPERDYPMFVDAIREFLSQRVLFCKDPRGVELLHTPRYMLDTIASRFYLQADCDDAAILAAALGKALGLRARFVALGFSVSGIFGRFQRVPLSHVYTEIGLPSGEWIPIDTTRAPYAVPPPASRVKRVEV